MNNKNGWGIVSVIVVLLFFVLCLIAAYLGITKLGLMNDVNKFFNPNYYNNTNTIYEKDALSYSNLETRVYHATKEYIEKEYLNNLYQDTLIIKVKTLKDKGYIKDFDMCSGYTEVFKNDMGIIEYKPYIKCKKYTTEGYLERKDNE